MSLVQAAIGVGTAVVLSWLVLVLILLAVRPDDVTLRSSLRLLPDVVRLVSRLARDPAVPRSVRLRLWLLLAYVASPIDLVPDFLPIVGFADDVIIVLWVLRSVARRSGRRVLEEHWPGTPEGLSTFLRLVQVG
jgi:uncharacterized membrane protein YkvA (DUF1232 family)